MAEPYGSDLGFTGTRRKPTALDNPDGAGAAARAGTAPYEPKPNELYYGGSATAAEEDLQRGRQKAYAATQRGAYQTNLGGFNESRGHTMGALELQRLAATGQAPSRAEIAGRAAMQQSLANQLAAAGSSRGGPANVAAAQRSAAMNAAGQRQQMVQSIAAERAGEMATARAQYGQTALGSQGQDIGASGLQQQSELFQRNLNQQGEQFYEGQGQHARDLELQAALERQRMADERAARARESKRGESKDAWEKTKDIVSIGAGLLSDAGAKMMAPMGGLGVLGLGGQPSPSSGPAREELANGAMVPMAELAKHGSFGTRFGRSPGAMPMRSDMGAKIPMYSDEETKSEPPSERGVAGAPRGYAASRAGQAGSMFSPPPGQIESGAGGEQLAPGTADFARYGAPMDLAASSPAWSTAPAAPAEEGRPLFGGVLGTLLGPRSDERAKKVLRAEQDFAEANRSMEAEPYAYKPGFAPPEQMDGEVNVGPMAQRMAQSDVARTAVKEEPDSDMLMLDRDKALKVTMGGLASLQKQVDALAGADTPKKSKGKR